MSKGTKSAPSRTAASVDPNDYPDNNPKTVFGSLKPDLSLIPPSALIFMALGFEDGATKYGPFNWREKKVSSRVYVAAAMRHLVAWLDGEENAPDSGKPHLGHALASIAILVDAQQQGNFNDNRPVSGTASFLLDKWSKVGTVEKVKE